jgi:type IV pilus assembly protein PilM
VKFRRSAGGAGGRAPEGVVNPDGHVIGLDIGATGIRAAILSLADNDEKRMSLYDAGQVALDDGVVVGGVVNNPAALTRALVGMWKDFDFGCRQVIIGMASPQAVVRAMQMPNLPPDQQAKALPYQAKDVIPLPLDEVLLDFQELGPVEGDPDSVNGLLVAAPRKPVVVAVKAVEAAGLRIVRVDLASFAALRAAAEPGVPTEAIVDIGAHLTTIVIHHLGVPRIVRTLGRGGQQLTERLVDRTGAGASEAEIQKRDIGLVGENSEIAGILTSAVRPLITEIRGSIQYFGTTSGSVNLDRISLTGGGARLPGFAEMLSQDTGIECTIVSPLQNVHNLLNKSTGDDDERLGAATAVAVGLALGAAK